MPEEREPSANDTDQPAKPIEAEDLSEPKEGKPIEPDAFSSGGTSIESPGAYQGGNPVGGPSSIFNIFGAPIAVLGGVFSAGLPIGGPVSEVFRSGAVSPPTLFIATLTPSGPIGVFVVGSGGSPLGPVGEGGIPFGMGPFEGGAPILQGPGGDDRFRTIPTGGQPIGGADAGGTLA